MELDFGTEEVVSTEISLHKPPLTALGFLLHNEHSLIVWNCRFSGAYQCSVIQKSLDESLTSQRPFSCHPKYRST